MAQTARPSLARLPQLWHGQIGQPLASGLGLTCTVWLWPRTEQRNTKPPEGSDQPEATTLLKGPARARSQGQRHQGKHEPNYL
eukprot:8350856-Alexandrium_andersonii.AAC.1